MYIKRIFIALLILCIFVDALSIKKITYRQKYRRIGAGDIIDALLFELYFDDDIYFLKNGTLTQMTNMNFTYNPTQPLLSASVVPICMGKSDQLCPVLPEDLKSLVGSLVLECPDNKSIPTTPYEDKVVYYSFGLGGNNLDFLIPMEPTQNPFQNFVNNLGWFNGSFLTEEENVIPNKLAFMMFNSLTVERVKYDFKLRPTLDDLQFCRFRLSNSSYTNSTITDRNGNPPTGLDTMSPIQARTGTNCPRETVTLAKELMKNITSQLPNARTWVKMMDALWTQGFVMLSGKMENCTNFLDKMLDASTKEQSFVSSDCFTPTRTGNWDTDPCCNPKYTWSDKCCYDRNVSVTSLNFNGTIPNITQWCSTPDQSDNLLQDYTSLRNIILDPVNGCDNVIKSYTYKQFNDDVGKAFQCYNNIRNKASPCLSDADCYCSTCNIITGFCNACNYTTQKIGFENCFRNNIPQQIVALARKDWGLQTATDEQFYQEFLNRTMTNYCVDLTGFPYPSTISCNAVYCRANYTTLSPEYAIVDPSNCTATIPPTCQVCTEAGNCASFPFNDECVYTEDKYLDSCSGSGFAYNSFEQSCLVRTSLTMTDCTCGTNDVNNYYCKYGFCTVTGTASTCKTGANDTFARVFNTQLNVCQVQVDNLATCNLVNNRGWRPGKTWRPREYNVTTQQECESLDLCVIAGKVVRNCTGRNICVGRCPKCEPAINGAPSVCYLPNTNQTYCVQTLKAFFDTTTGICLIPYKNQSECQSLGYVYENCNSLSYDECEACQGGLPECPLVARRHLLCKWNSQKMCDPNLPADQCQKMQYCQDTSFYPACAYTTNLTDSYGCPVCSYNYRNEKAPAKRTESLFFEMGPKIPQYDYLNQPDLHQNEETHEEHEEDHHDENGNVSSKKRSHFTTNVAINTIDKFSIMGCIAPSVTKSACLATGAKWIKPILTEQECLAIVGCKEQSGEVGCQFKADNKLATYDYSTNKSQADCVACGGTYGPINTWKSGVMVAPPRLFTSWQTSVSSPYRIKAPYINLDALKSTLEKYIYARSADAFIATIDCATSPVFQTDQIIQCDCVSVNNTMFAPGYCYSSKTQLNLGKHLVCRGDNKVVRTGKSTLTFLPDSVSTSSYCIRLGIEFFGAAQFKSQEVISSSSLLNSLTYKNNPYAIVKNRNGLVVGQLLADGIDLTIDTDVFNSYGKNTDDVTIKSDQIVTSRSVSLMRHDRRANSTLLINNFTLCISSRDDIKNTESDFTITDFATYDGTNFYPLKISNIQYTGGKYCGVISTNNTIIFPVALAKDWETRNSIFSSNKSIRDVMYFLSGAMFVLFLACIGALIYQFVLKRSINVSKISLVFLLFYSGLRAAFFLLFALEKLTSLSTKNPSGYFVLAELPYYIFISIFILLIIFWWKISKSTASILKMMVVPVLVVNFLLYSFFVVVCIVAAVVKGNGAKVLNKVYKTVVAAIALTLIITAWIFGGIVLKSAYKGFKMRTKGRNTKVPVYLIRTFIILIITSIALLFQIIYLLYITFKATPSPALSVSVYFLVEVIPAYVLYVLFAPVSKKRGTDTNRSRGTKFTNTDSKAGTNKKQSKYSRANNSQMTNNGKSNAGNTNIEDSSFTPSINHNDEPEDNYNEPVVKQEPQKDANNTNNANNDNNNNNTNKTDDNINEDHPFQDYIPLKNIHRSYSKFDESSDDPSHEPEVPDFVLNVANN